MFCCKQITRIHSFECYLSHSNALVRVVDIYVIWTRTTYHHTTQYVRTHAHTNTHTSMQSFKLDWIRFDSKSMEGISNCVPFDQLCCGRLNALKIASSFNRFIAWYLCVCVWMCCEHGVSFSHYTYIWRGNTLPTSIEDTPENAKFSNLRLSRFCIKQKLKFEFTLNRLLYVGH